MIYCIFFYYQYLDGLQSRSAILKFGCMCICLDWYLLHGIWEIDTWELFVYCKNLVYLACCLSIFLVS